MTSISVRSPAWGRSLPSGATTSTATKCSAVANTASGSRPAPQAMPMAAASQMEAAVVSPLCHLPIFV